jgi:hypothetical protein
MSLTSDFSLGEGDEFGEGDPGFDVLSIDHMPTGRLKDILTKIENSDPSVVNLDACIPSSPIGFQVFQTVLYKLKPSCKVLSLRFNSLSVECQDHLTEWIGQNDWLETLYLMGTGYLPPKLTALESAWKKNLKSHRKLAGIFNIEYFVIYITSIVQVQTILVLH